MEKLQNYPVFVVLYLWNCVLRNCYLSINCWRYWCFFLIFMKLNIFFYFCKIYILLYIKNQFNYIIYILLYIKIKKGENLAAFCIATNWEYLVDIMAHQPIPNNNLYISFNDDFILGKSSEKSDIFDVLCDIINIFLVDEKW